MTRSSLIKRLAAEVRNNLARHGHLVAGARVAPDPLAMRANGERAEAAQLDRRGSAWQSRGRLRQP